MQRAGSQVVCHSCDSYLREMTGAIWFPGLRVIWLHRSCSLFSSLVAAQDLEFLVCLLLLLQNTFSLTLLPVFLIGMRLYAFFPLPNIPGWTWTSNCSVCGVFIIRSIHQEPAYSGRAEHRMHNYSFQVEIGLKNCYEHWPSHIQNLLFQYFTTAMNRKSFLH